MLMWKSTNNRIQVLEQPLTVLKGSNYGSHTGICDVTIIIQANDVHVEGPYELMGEKSLAW